MPIPIFPILLGIGVVAIAVHKARSARQTAVKTVMRRVFYSFYYKGDAWRTSLVRNIGIVEKDRVAIDNDWETVAKKDDEAIQDWIDSQMHGRSCVVVLVGGKTATKRGVRKWIRYEIEQALEKNKALLGIRIHNLKNAKGDQDSPGEDPFERITCKDGTLLSSKVKLYNPRGGKHSKRVRADISENLAGWIEHAIANRPSYS